MDVARALLKPEPCSSDGDARAVIDRMEESALEPFDAALVHAARADRVGFAFVAAYLSATRLLAARLHVRAPRTARFALAATEDGGGHPRAIATTLTTATDAPMTLRGVKTFATLADEATHILVIARDGELDGRPNLKAVVVPRERAGMRMTRVPDTPFCPEIHHARVELDGVRVEADKIVSGDAYTTVLKPFRTVEDIFVQGAGLAFVAASASRAHTGDGPSPLALRAFAITRLLRELVREDPLAPTTHLALAGALELSSAVLEDFGALRGLPDDLRARFVRDRPLFRIASRVREARLARAFADLSSAAQKRPDTPT
ncbi:MAG: acyl-CoA dehydrogenase family protein [Polyangiaceae bacterium]